jgi:flagellar basal body P-ring formation protein FlgA
MKNLIIHMTVPGLLAVMLLAATAAANTITLRTSVRLAGEGDAIHLRDIANIEGDEAAQYADVKIALVNDPERAVELHVRQIRQALDAHGIHWGRVNLNGSRVLVRPRGRSIASPPIAMAGASIAGDEEKETDRRTRRQRDPMLAHEVMQSSTLRGAIAEFLAANLRVEPDHLRLEFDHRDDEVLDIALDEHRFEIEPVSSMRSNRVDLAVRLWSDGRAGERITVRVSPTMYMPVVLMKRDVSRGSIVTEDDIELVHQWLQPVHGGLVMSESEAVGRIATVRLSEGDALREQHVRRETLIRRGDLVIVRALVGGSVLTMQAEARASGSEGDTIEFRKTGERDTFLAIVTGRNEAIVDLQR